MKRKIISVIAAIGFIGFLGVMNYPYVSQMINERIQGEVILNYNEKNAKMTEERRQKMLADARAYNEDLANGKFSIKDVEIPNYEEIGKEYAKLLASESEGAIGVVRIPRIDVKLPIYHGTTAEVLEKGSGHLEGSSLPIGGESTHMCLTAHRGLPTKRMFTDVDMLEEGDIFYVDALDETLAYQIYEIETVLPSQVENLVIKKGEELATLITCTPYGVNTHRIFIHGYRIAHEGETEGELNLLSKEFWINFWWIPATILLLIWMIFLLRRFNRNSESSKK